MRRGVAAQDSLEMSWLLLEDMAAGHEAQYGAVVFDDPIIQAIPQALRDVANATGIPVGLNGLAGLGGGTAGLLGVLPLLAGDGLPFPFPGLPSSALLGRLGTPEARVLVSLVDRFRSNPGALP